MQGVWAPATIPFLQLTNTTLVILKVCVLFAETESRVLNSDQLYSALMLATCAMCILCFNLPGAALFHPNSLKAYSAIEFLPGKRALAIGLTIYHTTCSTILYQAPRFIPMSFGELAEGYVFLYTNSSSCALIVTSTGMVSFPRMFGALYTVLLASEWYFGGK